MVAFREHSEDVGRYQTKGDVKMSGGYLSGALVDMDVIRSYYCKKHVVESSLMDADGKYEKYMLNIEQYNTNTIVVNSSYVCVCVCIRRITFCVTVLYSFLFSETAVVSLFCGVNR